VGSPLLTLGCPSYLDFEEEYKNKHMVLRKGNQQKKQPCFSSLRVGSPLLTLLPRNTARHSQKNGKHRVIFDSSTQTCPHEIVLNHETSTDQEAIIDFGTAKTQLLVNIYNWRISYPTEVILLALADITACFRFPQLSADVTGAFGFLAESLYFISTSYVFGLNTSASSWEPLRRAVKNMITVYFERNDLVEKHKELLDELKWSNDLSPRSDLVKAFCCIINQGVLDEKGILLPMKANIYVDDILAAAARRERMLRLLAAILEAIFVVCETPDIAVRQCPLSLEKWHELIVGPRQIILECVCLMTGQLEIFRNGNMFHLDRSWRRTLHLVFHPGS